MELALVEKVVGFGGVVECVEVVECVGVVGCVKVVMVGVVTG